MGFLLMGTHLRLNTGPVGAGLPAIAVAQIQICCLNQRYRRQASSYILIVFNLAEMFR
jgi:hypothetical protein